MGIERSVRFSLRNLIFECDEEKNRKNIENTEFLSKLPPAFSSIMTASKCMTRNIVQKKIAIIQ